MAISNIDCIVLYIGCTAVEKDLIALDIGFQKMKPTKELCEPPEKIRLLSKDCTAVERDLKGLNIDFKLA